MHQDLHPTLASLADLSTTLLSDNLQRLVGICGLQRFHGDAKLLGKAFTVKVRPGDNLAITQALQRIEPGDVLVVDGHGDTTNALVGELLMLYAIQRGCAGFVIDGAIRDIDAFKAAAFPCYARAVSHRGPYKNGPGELSIPVSIAGQVVMPGEFLFGDADGIVNIAPDRLPHVMAHARDKLAAELKIKHEIANGKREQSWLDQA